MKSQLFCCALLFLSYAAANEVCTPDSDGVEPCDGLELSCIQEYFQKRADCQPAVVDSDVLNLGTISMSLPSFQMKIDQLNTTFDQLDGEIFAFTVNDAENLAVLGVKFSNFSMISNAVFKYFPTGKEPRIFSGISDEFYGSVKITTYFPLKTIVESESSESSSEEDSSSSSSSSSSSEESSSVTEEPSSSSEESSSSSEESSSTSEESSSTDSDSEESSPSSSSSSSSSSSEESSSTEEVVKGLDLASAKHFSYIAEEPIIDITGDCLDTDDEVLAAVLEDFNNNINKAVIEAWKYVGKAVAEYYIQNNICNYNI